MKKVFLTIIFAAFAISAIKANDGFNYSKNLISHLKEKTIYSGIQDLELRELNSKLRNHFAYMGILTNDWTNEVIMSLKANLDPIAKLAIEVEINEQTVEDETNMIKDVKSSEFSIPVTE